VHNTETDGHRSQVKVSGEGECVCCASVCCAMLWMLVGGLNGGRIVASLATVRHAAWMAACKLSIQEVNSTW